MRAAAHAPEGDPVGWRWDRRADERTASDLRRRLRADPRTRVLTVWDDCAATTEKDGQVRLTFDGPDELRGDRPWAFLGRTSDGVGVVAVAGEGDPSEGTRPLREVGSRLVPAQREMFTVAVSITRWLRAAPFCPRCGAHTRIGHGGWSRQCPGCGTEHFPRTDPAVIVAITDQEDRHLLLGSNVMWPRGRFSLLAGFVESGERAEDAVMREVREEAGVDLERIRYRDSQVWPYPRSLMLGFEAVAVEPRAARPDGDEIVELRWLTRAQIGTALHEQEEGVEGEITLPGPSSIAHRLIRTWHGRRR